MLFFNNNKIKNIAVVFANCWYGVGYWGLVKILAGFSFHCVCIDTFFYKWYNDESGLICLPQVLQTNEATSLYRLATILLKVTNVKKIKMPLKVQDGLFIVRQDREAVINLDIEKEREVELQIIFSNFPLTLNVDS